jgi:hypothetical protein
MTMPKWGFDVAAAEALRGVAAKTVAATAPAPAPRKASRRESRFSVVVDDITRSRSLLKCGRSDSAAVIWSWESSGIIY